MRFTVVLATCLFVASGAFSAEPVGVVATEIRDLQSIVAKLRTDPAEPVGKPVVDRAEPVGLRELQAATPQLAAAVGSLQRAYQKADSKKGLELAGAMSVAVTQLQKEIAAYAAAADPKIARRTVGSIETLLVTLEKLRKEIEPCCNVFTAASKAAAGEACRKQAAALKSKACEAREAGGRAPAALFTCVCN
jgi:hypothetical protein